MQWMKVWPKKETSETLCVAREDAMKKNSGQSLIEFTMSLPLLVLLFGVSLGLIYLICAKWWLQYQAKEAAYCLLETKSLFVCKSRFEDRVNKMLDYRFISYSKTEISSNKSTWNGYWKKTWIRPWKIRFSESWTIHE